MKLLELWEHTSASAGKLYLSGVLGICICARKGGCVLNGQHHRRVGLLFEQPGRDQPDHL